MKAVEQIAVRCMGFLAGAVTLGFVGAFAGVLIASVVSSRVKVLSVQQWAAIIGAAVGIGAIWGGVIGLRMGIAITTAIDPTQCARCGYDMRATPYRCPECGTTPDAIKRN